MCGVGKFLHSLIQLRWWLLFLCHVVIQKPSQPKPEVPLQKKDVMEKEISMQYSFGYQTGRRTGPVLWVKLPLVGQR